MFKTCGGKVGSSISEYNHSLSSYETDNVSVRWISTVNKVRAITAKRNRWLIRVASGM